MFKRKIALILFSIIVLVSRLGVARPSYAQDSNPPIILNANTPSVDIVVSGDNGAPGVVYIEMNGVHASLRDANGNELLSVIDKRITELAIQIAQGTAPQTLHLELLPGIEQAQLRITAQSALPIVNTRPQANADVQPVSSGEIIQNKVALAPAQTIPVSVSDTSNLLSVEVPGSPATVQLTDDKGAVLMTSSTGKEITGLSVRLDKGSYSLSLASADLNNPSEALMTLSQAPVLTLTADNAQSGNSQQSAVLPQSCTATVNVSSMNLRSGPGTAYSVLGSVSQTTNLVVGGVNREGGWILVKGPNGTAWIAQSSATLNGGCGTLPKFDIPLRNYVPQAADPAQPAQGGNNGNSGEHHEDEHHENEGEHSEGEGEGD
jgi:hypothetical protein